MDLSDIKLKEPDKDKFRSLSGYYVAFPMMFTKNREAKNPQFQDGKKRMKKVVVTKGKIVASILLIFFGIYFYRILNYHSVDIDTLLNGRWIMREKYDGLDFDLICVHDTITYTSMLEEKLSRELQFASGDSLNLKKFYKTYDPKTRLFYVNHQRVGYLVYVSSTDIEIMTIKYGMIKAHAPGHHW